MRRSYIAQSAFSLNDVAIRPGDILVHDPNNGSKLIVYRNREIVKVTKHSALGMQTMLKNAWVSLHEEQSAPPAPAKPVVAPVVPPIVAPTPKIIPVSGDDLVKVLHGSFEYEDSSPPVRLSRAERKALRQQGK